MATRAAATPGGNSGGDSNSQAPAPSSQGQAPSGSGTTTTQPQQSEGTVPQATQSQAELPRTGYPAWLAGLAGGVLLASGATLRISLGLRR